MSDKLFVHNSASSNSETMNVLSTLSQERKIDWSPSLLNPISRLVTGWVSYEFNPILLIDYPYRDYMGYFKKCIFEYNVRTHAYRIRYVYALRTTEYTYHGCAFPDTIAENLYESIIMSFVG